MMTLRWIGSLSVMASVYVIVAAIACCYQLILLMGRIGLAPLGRFATFVMVPGMLFFRFNGFQATIVASFVELAGASAATIASSMRIGLSLDDSDRKIMHWYQIVALIMSAVTVAMILWIFSRYLGFGVQPLFAQRAQSRALLIGAHEMNIGVLIARGSG